ncbi:PREDICTED: nuclear factor related to kappa-B-binding protein isoform X3 [Wasmannia auropunctata]|uniref:nuclear factor related to kappa-B-binding protein isoform X3 n=1 Tax=Wasmannia auropunctata TaxID=64793 RepID=UPI0005EF3C40|nr:PREDICTED: nuclear factor related to kappa-B-binding protein isoform X3 [Wasmannia auropunctata]
MEIDECSAGGDSGAEEDEEEASTHDSRTDSSSSSMSGSSTTTDSEQDSAEDHATSSSESHSSAEEDEDENENAEFMRWETCVAANIKVKLPQDLCEHFSIFKEMLDYPRFWNEWLTESQRETLYNLLPTFPKDSNIEAQMEKSLQMLFNRENDRFGVTALDTFHNHLSSGHYRPDIKRIRGLVRKAQKRRSLFEERKRSYELANQLLKSRESLLSNAYRQGFNQPVNRTMSKLHWRKSKPIMVEEKTQLRYLEELNAVRAELRTSTRLSADTTSENEENYPHYQMTGAKQKRKRRFTMNLQGLSVKGLQLSHEDDTIRPVFSTLQRMEYASNRSLFVREQTEETYRAMLIAHKKRRARRDLHPELNTQGIALADLTQRSQIGQKQKLTIGNSTKVTSAKKKIKLEQNSLCPPAPKLPNSNSIKHESDNSDYSHTTDDNKQPNIADVDYNRMTTPIKSEPIEAYEVHPVAKKKISPVTQKSSKPAITNIPEIKKEIEDTEFDKVKTELSLGVSEDVLAETEEEEENESKKELDLDSIDMMQLPIQLDDGIDILDDVKCEDEGIISIPETKMTVPSNECIDVNNGAELMQETHTCFFSLLRDAFTSKGEYRMSAAEMKEAITQWQSNPISPLNDWYSLVPSWSTLVPLALGFLAGELMYSQDLDQRQERDQELVPYLENKGRGVYAWIGAGRDSDTRLQDLCTKFLMYKDVLTPPYTPTTSTVTATKSQQSQFSSNNNSMSNNAIVTSGILQSGRSGSPTLETTNMDASASGTDWEPPRPLFPTEWKVRPSTIEEREEFRRQERMRYAAPHKAFTYRMHGYASVVGPVKGIYQHNVASGQAKARGHSLLVPDRPNFVTILALVRDATARLPNGEGTRADICQLLKDSQYIIEQDNDEKEGYLHSVVSGALDRLHYETDPCVRYYPRRKEWLYLHRGRSESEFEMVHQQLQGIAKNKKSVGNTSRNKVVQPILKSANINKEQSSNTKEVVLKKERRITAVTTQPVIPKKEQRKTEDKIVPDHPIPTEHSVNANVEMAVSTITSAISTVETPVSVASIVTSSATATNVVSTERDNIAMDTKSQLAPITMVKKASTVGGKPIAVLKTNAAQSLLQSNQHNFPHHQIQVSTSAGLQTIRLSGHSVLQSAQQSASTSNSSNVVNGTTNLTTILPSAKTQNQQQQQSAIMTNQTGKSILQTTNIKQQSQQQQQQQHVLPGKTLLASQIKLVSSSQIKSLLTSHGLQGQTIFIKQSSPSNNQSQQQQLQQQQQQQQQQLKQQQLQQRVTTNQQQPVQQTPGMQRIIAQIGGKPIAVQIQQSPHHHQQQQQQKILAKVLTNSSGGQIISVESLLAQKGLKLATTGGHTNQLNRQGKQVIQAQYQVVPQAQASSSQSKIIAVSTQHQQSQPQQAQTVRMVTAQLAGKPIVLASSNKNVGVAVSTSGGNVVLGKQPTSQQQQQQQTQQPIILPSQLLNIKTLHGLKVIPTPTGLKTAGGAVYARVIAPTTIASTQATSNQQQTLQTQSPRNPSYGTP